jgi:hypothetical protein
MCGEQIFVWVLLFSPIILTFFQFLFLGIVNRKVGIRRDSWKKFGTRLLYNMVEITFIYIILSNLIISIFVVIIQYFFSNDQSLMYIFIKNNFPNYPYNFITYLSKFDITSSVNGNQLSLAGFYFALAIGGLVTLSIIDRYFKKETSFREEMLNQVNTFNELYSNYKLFPTSLDLTSILSFDNKNIKFKKLKNKKIINLNYESVERLANLLSQLQTKLACAEIENERIILNRYKLFNIFVASTYIAGIATILIPKELATVSLWIFIADSFCFGALLIKIYRDYIR